MNFRRQEKRLFFQCKIGVKRKKILDLPDIFLRLNTACGIKQTPAGPHQL